MKRPLLICGLLIALAAVTAWAQGVIMCFYPSTTVVVGNTSTLLTAGTGPNCDSAGGPGRVHYDLLENRGSTAIVFDFASSITSTSLYVNGATVTFYVGHLLNPLDAYELPAEKEYNGPLSAISTNAGVQGIAVLSVAHNVN